MAPVAAWAAAGALLGMIVGSYLATIVVRWPRGEPARGRSRCDGCDRVLRPIELMPLLSFVAARGRCHACGGRIDRRHPTIELLAALTGAAALGLAPGPVGLAGAVSGWLLIALAALDLDHFWLPDRLTGTLAALGLAGGIVGLSPALADRLIGGAAGFLMLWSIAAGYRRVRGREGMGAGDAKLFGAIGLWLGWRALPPVLLLASLIGLAAVIALRGGGRRMAADSPVPLGTLLAAAAIAIWLARAAGMTWLR